MNTKKDIFQKHENQNQNPELPWIFSKCNALTTQKSVAVYFKDVKTEETFSSQD